MGAWLTRAALGIAVPEHDLHGFLESYLAAGAPKSSGKEGD